MPRPPSEQNPPLGKSIKRTYRQPQIVELSEDLTLVVMKEVNAAGYREGARGDAHPDTVKYPTHILDTIIPSPDGTTAAWTYIVPRTSLVSYQVTGKGQTATITETAVTEGTAPVVPTALILAASEENLADGRRKRTVTAVPNVFPGTEFSSEIADPVPPEFRDIVPVKTVAASSAGSAADRPLVPGELRHSELQETEQIKRVSTTGRDVTVLPVVITDQETSEAFGFGGVMDIAKTLDKVAQAIDEGLNVVSSSVRHLPGGLTLKETEALAGGENASLDLTDGGSGFTSAPTVSFSGGLAAGGGAGSASISDIVPQEAVAVERTFVFNGDANGALFYLGAAGNNGTWRNPNANGDIVISAPYDTLEFGTFDSMVDRQPSNTYLVARDGAELWFDLGVGRTLLCKSLSFRQRADFHSPMGLVSIQGSTDGTTWGQSQSLTVDRDMSAWTHLDTPNFSVPYRYFRLILPAGVTQLMIGELELYGTLSLPAVGSGGGSVTGVSISNGGEYLTPPSVVFSGGGGAGAAGTAVLVGSVLSQVEITNPGSGYTSAPTVAFTGGIGNAATATAEIATTVTSISVSAGGSGYATPPAVKIAGGGGGGATAVAVLNSGVGSALVNTAGTGYTSPPTVALTGGGGTGAVATAVLGFSAVSTSVTAAGSGYTSDPVVTVTGDGEDAAFSVVRGLPVASAIMNSQGSGYTSNPVVTLSGDGAGCSANAVRGFGVASVAMTDQGAGYSATPVVSISGGAGAGAIAEAVLDPAVYSITTTNSGSGYTTAPVISFSGGGGTGAAATCDLGDVLNYLSDGDTNGVFYFLGALGNGGTWRNPQTNGDIAITSSTLVTGAVADLVDRAVGDVQTQRLSPGDFTFDLLSGRQLICNYVSIRNNTVDVSGDRASDLPYLFQGSPDGSAWTTLRSLSTFDNTVNGWNSFSIVSSTPYRYFRLAGSTFLGRLAAGEIELYGSLLIASGGEVVHITLTNPGTGYTSVPTVVFTGGAGTGAAATAVVANKISGITVTNPGGNFETAPSVAVTDDTGSGAAATATLRTAGGVKRIALLGFGTGYTFPPVVGITGGGGTGAAATSTLNTAAPGTIKRLDIINAGSGYTTAPALAITGGGGSGATATVALAASGKVARVDITTPGSGYTSAPALAFSGGGGSGAVAVALLSLTKSVGSVLVTSGGSGYKTVPAVSFVGGGGSGAAAAASLAGGGTVVLLTLTNSGNYLTIPTVIFTGGGGTGAAALYLLGGTWPTLIEVHTDPVEGIVVNVEKKIVPAGTLYSGGFVEIQSLDKWRSIQLRSVVDLSTLPQATSYTSTHSVELPDYLVSITPIWEMNKTSSSRVNTGFSQSSVSLQAIGKLMIQRLSGFRGTAHATVERSFFFGLPPDGHVPVPTVIQPSSGTIRVTSRNNSESRSSGTQGGRSYVEHNTGIGTSVDVVDIGGVLTSGISTSGSSPLYSAAGERLDAEANAIGIDTTYPNFASSSASATADYQVFIPPSNPTFVAPGQVILVSAIVEKWRLGVYVLTLTYAVVPDFPRV